MNMNKIVQSLEAIVKYAEAMSNDDKWVYMQGSYGTKIVDFYDPSRMISKCGCIRGHAMHTGTFSRSNEIIRSILATGTREHLMYRFMTYCERVDRLDLFERLGHILDRKTQQDDDRLGNGKYRIVVWVG